MLILGSSSCRTPRGRLHRAFAVLLALCAWAAPALAQRNFVPDRVLVKFHRGVDAAGVRRAAEDVRARVDGYIDGAGVHIFRLNNRNSERFVERVLKERPDVEFAEPDWVFEPAETIPNDPAFANWQWALTRVSCPGAWDVSRGSASIIIAVLDTGVDASHPDLAPNLVAGRNVWANNNNTHDTIGHGTMVAGVVGAATNNSIGIAGVAWNCRIMPVKITSDSSSWTTASTVAAALDWAGQHGARVANCSYRVSESATVASAAQAFMGRGGVVTVSAGNDGMFVSTADVPSILTVAATNYADGRATYSNYGAVIDLSAPGDVFTTGLSGQYGAAGGTSFSAPMVAGVAGLVMAANPSLSAQQVMDILCQSSDDLGTAGRDTTYGWGRLNAASAVAMAGGTPGSGDSSPPGVAITSPASGAYLGGVVTVAVSASDNVGVVGVRLLVNGAPVALDQSAPYTFLWDTTSLPNGSCTLSAEAADAAGNVGADTRSVVVSNAGADTQPPAVAITSPGEGQRVSGNVTINTSASDNVGVVRVDLFVDGASSASSTTAPFSFRWNTRRVSGGWHTLQLRAYDGAGNMGESAIVRVQK